MFLALKKPLRSFAPPPASYALPERDDIAPRPLHAERGYRPGDVVFRFDDGALRSQRDHETVQHPGGRHVFHPMLARTAHSCEPNCCVSFPISSMVAVRTIEAGEAITYDYETTETWFSHPFWCRCASRRCRGRIG
jgi:hypothetical protein